MDETKSVKQLADEALDKRDLVTEAKAKFNVCQNDWSDIMTQSTKDIKFFDGQQDDEVTAQAVRRAGNKVKQSINVVAPFVQQIDNARRQQNMALVAHATDEQGSEDTAKVISGLFRHIENISNAKHAYNVACGPSGALVGGVGYLKVETRYLPNSFDQDIYITAPKNQFNILPDFNAQKPDFSDAEFWFEFDEMTKPDFKKMYPKSTLASFPNWKGKVKTAGGWLTDNTVRVAKYWYKDVTKLNFVEFEDGTTGFAHEFGLDEDLNIVDETMYPTMEDDSQQFGPARKPFGDADDSTAQDEDAPLLRPMGIERSRDVEQVEVKWVITNGIEVLEEGEWHNDVFPFVPFLGNEIYIDGKRIIHGVIRHVRDPQCMVNFLNSELIRKTAATTKSQWIADIDSIPPKFINDWASSNMEEKAVLFWSSKQNGGGNMKPERADMAEPQIEGLLASINNSVNNIRMTMGIQNPTQDPTSNQNFNNMSGIAIQTLAEQGQLINFHFSDNFVMGMKRLGEIILGLVPCIYDTARIIPLIGLDNEIELVKINQVFETNGKSMVHDLTAESYGIQVDTGPSYATQKAQQSESMIKFASLDPEITPVIMDNIVDNLDWDTSGKIKDKIVQFQAFKFPWLKHGEMDTLPPEAKAAIVQLQQQLQQAQQHVAVINDAYQKEKQRNDANVENNQSKERIEAMRQHGQLEMKKWDLLLEIQDSKDQLALEHAKAEVAHITDKQKLILDHVKHMDRMSASQSHTQSH